jgi:hypothetical protein
MSTNVFWKKNILDSKIYTEYRVEQFTENRVEFYEHKSISELGFQNNVLAT